MSTPVEPARLNPDSSAGDTAAEPAAAPVSMVPVGDVLRDHLLAALRLLKGNYRLRSRPGCAPELLVELDERLCDELRSTLRAEHGNAAGETDAPVPTPGLKVKILVADDSAIERRCLHTILSRDQRIEPVEANDGHAAWDLLDGGLNPVLCILDIMMPRLNGLEVVERMRADSRFARTPVVLCTAAKDRDTVTRAAPLSVSYYLVKPYSSADILGQVERVLGKFSGEGNLDPK